MKVENKRKTNNKYNNKYNIERKFKWLPISLILFLAAVLYFYQIEQESLWIDEILSIRSSQTIIDKFGLNRPLYFILLNVWMRFGDSEAWLRSLSVVFGLISVWLVYQLGIRLANQATGLVAALLLTLSPLVINHAQEVRMYVVSMCLGLGGSLILINVLDQFAVSALIGWLCLRFLAVLTTPINILLFLPDVVLLGIKFRNQKRYLLKLAKKWPWLLIAATVLSLIALKDIVPPLLDLLAESKQIIISPPGVTAFVGTITRFTIGSLASPITALESVYDKFLNVYALFLLSLLGLALFTAQKLRSSKLWYAAAWAFLPLGMLFVLCQVYPQVWGVDRYFLFAAPYVLLLLAAGWLRLIQTQKAIAIMMIGLYAITLGCGLFNYYTVQQREDLRGVTQVIQAEAKPGDAIALFPNYFLSPLNYYYQGNSPIYTLEPLPKEKLFLPIDKLLLKQTLHDLLKIKSRFWLVFVVANTGFNNKNQVLEEVVNEQFEVLTHRSFTGIELFLINPFNNEHPP